MTSDIELLILSGLVESDTFLSKSFPFLKPDYFSNSAKKTLFDLTCSFINEYKTRPSKDSLLVEIENLDGLSESDYKEIVSITKQLSLPSDVDLEWLVNKTEKHCQDKAVYNAIMDSIHIIDGKDTKLDKGSIPQILSDALAVSFQTDVGHDYLEDALKRYEFYHRDERKLPFDIELLNKITSGGIAAKTLTVLQAGTGVGKSLAMCHMTSAHLLQGKNVLYITLEMAAELIAERIDVNLMDLSFDELKHLPKSSFQKKLERIQSKTTGRLIVKEYPTATAGANHFRHLLNELKLKQKFVPDVIYIDYINISVSCRHKMGGSVNTYYYIKSIAEELRGLAVEQNVPIITATQTNRQGQYDSDADLSNTSESFGLPQTADLMIGLISTEELEAMNQIMFKQLKNRYNTTADNKRFVVGIDRSKMRLYDVEQSAQQDISDDMPVMDNAKFGERQKEDDTMKFMTKKAGRKNFEGIQC